MHGRCNSQLKSSGRLNPPSVSLRSDQLGLKRQFVIWYSEMIRLICDGSALAPFLSTSLTVEQFPRTQFKMAAQTIAVVELRHTACCCCGGTKNEFFLRLDVFYFSILNWNIQLKIILSDLKFPTYTLHSKRRFNLLEYCSYFVLHCLHHDNCMHTFALKHFFEEHFLG